LGGVFVRASVLLAQEPHSPRLAAWQDDTLPISLRANYFFKTENSFRGMGAHLGRIIFRNGKINDMQRTRDVSLVLVSRSGFLDNRFMKMFSPNRTKMRYLFEENVYFSGKQAR
jgi:hypothetical protein